MNLFSSFEISGSGLSAQRARMDVVSNNIANVDTTRTAEWCCLAHEFGILHRDPSLFRWAA